MMSIELAAVLSVFDPPANFMVLVNVLDPVASCLTKSVSDCPATGLVNAENVTLPVSVTVCMLPLVTSGVMVEA